MRQDKNPKPTSQQRRAEKAKRAPFINAIYQGSRLRFAFCALMILISSLLDIVVAYILQQVLDTAISGSLAQLGRLGVFTAVFFIAYWIVTLLYIRTKHSFIRRAMTNYKAFAFERITRKSISSFTGESTGRYISALTNDAQSVETNYLPSLLNLIVNGTWFIGSLAMMVWYSWQLTAAVLVLCTLPIAVSVLFGGRLTQQERAVSDRNEGFVGMVKDLLTGFSVIKSFKAEKEVSQLFSKENDTLEQQKYKRRMTAAAIEIISALSGFVVQFGVMFFGVYLCLKGRITAGVVIAFVQLMNYILTPVKQAPSILANRKAALGLIDKLADASQWNASRMGKAVDSLLDESIQLTDVRFGYEPGQPVLDGVSFRFEAGKSYAIVGGSGCGKTTLLNLLMGSYDGYQGSIRYDGDELTDISSDSLYELISIIQQNVFVFDNTVRANITMFKDFPQQRIDSAIARAGLADFIHTHGEDYRCGENGSALSGGEKQRISIARCLLRGTPVLLMDEATAALDAETAFEVTSAILNVESLTRIIVTHRLEAPLLKRFDRILVLRKGKIQEQGGFDELMGRKGYFYSLYNVSN